MGIEQRSMREKYKVLVVDDEITIADSIAYALRRECYKVEVAYDGEEALQKIRLFYPDVIILDVMMPKCDGYEVCKSIEKDNAIGIIMLTAKDDLIDKVLGLELGADDYLTKPFEMIELLARVKSLCRRMNKLSLEEDEQTLDVMIIEGLRIDLKQRIVSIEEKQIEFKPKEFDLLAFLFKNPRHVFSRDDILNSVWEMDYIGGTRTIDIHIQRVRKKLGQHGQLIKTVSKVGYKVVPNFNED